MFLNRSMSPNLSLRLRATQGRRAAVSLVVSPSGLRIAQPYRDIVSRLEREAHFDPRSRRSADPAKIVIARSFASVRAGRHLMACSPSRVLRPKRACTGFPGGALVIDAIVSNSTAAEEQV